MAFSVRRTAQELLATALLVAHLFMGWKALAYATNCTAPIAVVTSESMEPSFQRGDILFLSNWPATIQVGDIALVAFETRKLPMVCYSGITETSRKAVSNTVLIDNKQVHRVHHSYHLPGPPDEDGVSSRAMWVVADSIRSLIQC